MAEQTAIAIQVGKKALVGGLNWQPLTQTGYSAKVSEVRDLADRVDANRKVSLKTRVGEYVGLYGYDPDLSDETRTRNVYSLAAAFASKNAMASAILLYRLQVGARKGDYAVVVIDQGAPSLDLIAAEAEALATVQTYQDSVGSGPQYTIYSNVETGIHGCKALATDYFNDAFVGRFALTGLPTDLIKAAIVFGGLFVLLASLYGVDLYLEDSARKEQMAKLESMSKLPQYLAQLEADKMKIGLKSDDVQKLLLQLQEQPVIAKGWVLTKLGCNQLRCTGVWNSRGGYTDELSAFLVGQSAEPDRKNTKVLQFAFPQPIAFSGQPDLSQLPKKPATANLVFSEQQAWEKAALGFKTNAAGEVWPKGFTDIPEANAVYSYPIQISGSLPLVNDFLSRYSQGVFWNTVSINVNMENLTKAVTVELEGAFYAY